MRKTKGLVERASGLVGNSPYKTSSTEEKVVFFELEVWLALRYSTASKIRAIKF